MKPKYTCSESKNVVTLSRFMLCSFAVNTDPTLDTPDDDLKLPDGFRPQLSAPPSLVELPANLPQLFVLTRLLIDDYSYPGKLLRNWVQGSAITVDLNTIVRAIRALKKRELVRAAELKGSCTTPNAASVPRHPIEITPQGRNQLARVTAAVTTDMICERAALPEAPESVERKVHLVDLPHSVLEIFCLSRFGIASFSFHTELHQSFQIASQVAIHKSRITSAINRLIDKQDIAPGLPDGTEVQSSSRIRPFHITEKGKRDLTIVLRALGIKLIADN